IYGMCNGLIEAGAELVAVYDPDPEKVKRLVNTFPQAIAAQTEEEVLNDPQIKLTAGAGIPYERAALGPGGAHHGMHAFADEPALTTLEQVDQARLKTKETGLKWGIYYGERLHVESAVFAGQLIEEGAIGRVVQVIGTGPHRANVKARPDWFFDPAYYGGI